MFFFYMNACHFRAKKYCMENKICCISNFLEYQIDFKNSLGKIRFSHSMFTHLKHPTEKMLDIRTRNRNGKNYSTIQTLAFPEKTEKFIFAMPLKLHNSIKTWKSMSSRVVFLINWLWVFFSFNMMGNHKIFIEFSLK